MTQHQIEDQNGQAYVDDIMLLYHYRFEEAGPGTFEAPEVDVCKAQPTTNAEREQLYGALYDITQCEDGFKDGDEFLLPDGTVFARIVGFHVIRVGWGSE